MKAKNEIKITKKPTPIPNERNHGNSVYPWDELEPGHSFTTNSEKHSSLRTLCYLKNKEGARKYVCRRTESGATVWRTAALIGAAFLFIGCAPVRLTSRHITYGTNGLPLDESKSTAWALTWWDARQTIESMGAKVSGKSLSVGAKGIDEQSSATNVVELFRAGIEGAVTGFGKTIKP